MSIPLHLHTAADPAWGRAVVSRLDLHAAIQVNCALAILVVAERLHRQGLQSRRSSANMAPTCRLVVP